MKIYRLLRPVYRPIDPTYWCLKFELIRLIEAPSVEDALVKAKRLGYYAPVVAPAKGPIQ